jgi:hypothetical protein
MTEKSLSVELVSLSFSTAALCEICDFEIVSDNANSNFSVMVQANNHMKETGHGIFFREMTNKESKLSFVEVNDNDTIDLGPKGDHCDKG